MTGCSDCAKGLPGERFSVVHGTLRFALATRRVCQELFHEAGEKALDRTRSFYHHHLRPDPFLVDPHDLRSRPAQIDSLDATTALIKWAKQRRGFEYSQYRAQLWELVVEIAHAALWLAWLFPFDQRCLGCGLYLLKSNA